MGELLADGKCGRSGSRISEVPGSQKQYWAGRDVTRPTVYVTPPDVHFPFGTKK